ncbi:MAG: hypothetical protein SX243_10600 [Acidobacteriota bacterium]|nr:hypothetical protein [Acidobacteriota bacterium]
MPRLSRILLVAAGLLAWAALPADALVERDGTSLLSAKETRHPALYIGNVYRSADQLDGTATDRSVGLSGLDVAASNAYLDLRSGRWGTLLLSEPMIPGTGVGNNLSWSTLRQPEPADDRALEAAAWSSLRSYLEIHQLALALDPAEIEPRVAAEAGGSLVQIHGRRVVDGIPVRDSFLTAVINHGNLILMGVRNWGDITTPASPTLDREQATSRVAQHIAPVRSQGFWDRTELLYVPMARGLRPDANPVGEGLDYRLVWVVRPNFTGHIERYEALVDAHSGELVSFQDTAHYASPREVVGGVLPVSNDGVAPDGVEQAEWPMPYTNVIVGGEVVYTDAGGNLPACVDGTIESTLDGLYMSMNDNCGAISESTAGDTLDFGTSPGTDCNVAGGASAGNTRSSRSGFYEMNRIKEAARGYLPGNVWLQQKLISNMNINSNCNASWNGQVNFFTSGGGCNNTGEIAGVFDHEWGHGMDNNDLTGSVSNPGEGIADIFASLRLNTSCIGRNFRATNCTGFGDACLSCTGVREIDWAQRASGNPHGIAFIDGACGAGPSPCGGGVHCEGQVYAEAVWDLYARDLQGIPFNYDLNTALEETTRLTYYGSATVGSWYSCVNGTATGDGCNADGGYLNYLAADDDNGNLGDGTPHMSAIFAAFDRHDIACPTPAVTNSGCAGAPTAAPVVSATALDRGAHVTWGAVAGAVSYQVFRTDGVFGCDFGKIMVADTTDLEFYDTELQNGRDYYYSVMAVGTSNACRSPMSTCQMITATPGANLGINAASVAVAPSTGDGDAYLDNCETATISFDVDNIGTGALTNVQLLDVQVISHPEVSVITSLPTAVTASLAECGPGTAQFDITSAGTSYQESMQIMVEVTADEISPQTRTAVLTLGGLNSDMETFASHTFSFETGRLEGWQVNSGIFALDDSFAGGDSTTDAVASSNALNGACDRIRSPEIRLTATSTLSLWNNYDIEPLSGGTWYDRANVALVDSTDTRTLVTPDSGRPYNADSSGPGNFSGCLEPEEGWADTEATWGTSSWSAGALGSVGVAGLPRYLEVTYSTDGALALRGFYFDEVTLTDFDLQTDDGQLNTCNVTTSIFGDGFEGGGTGNWSNVVGGTP